MKNLTTQEINFKLSMVNELLEMLEKKSDRLNEIVANKESYDYGYFWHSKELLTHVSFCKAILNCESVEGFFDLTSGKPEILEFIK